MLCSTACIGIGEHVWETIVEMRLLRIYVLADEKSRETFRYSQSFVWSWFISNIFLRTFSGSYSGSSKEIYIQLPSFNVPSALQIGCACGATLAGITYNILFDLVNEKVTTLCSWNFLNELFQVVALTVVSIGVAVATVTDLQFSLFGGCVALAWIIPSAVNKILWANMQQRENWTALAYVTTRAVAYSSFPWFLVCFWEYS